MHYTKVIMKDGREFYGPIWEWRPEEGWFSLAIDSSAPDRIYFREVLTGTTENDRIGVDKIADQDILERAVKDGWNE